MAGPAAISTHAAAPAAPATSARTTRRPSRGVRTGNGLTGDILTMPGLPREPAARRITVHDDGRITGLMQGE